MKPCPVCSSPVQPESAWLPFCSERCRLLDLGHWIEGDYRIPAQQEEVNDPGEFEDPDEVDP